MTFWPSFTGALDAADTGPAVNTNMSAATAATSGMVLIDFMTSSFVSTVYGPGGRRGLPTLAGYPGLGNLPIVPDP